MFYNIFLTHSRTAFLFLCITNNQTAIVKNLQKIFGEYLLNSKKSRNFAEQNRKAWKDGRVVDCIGLENRRGSHLRGFESLSFR